MRILSGPGRGLTWIAGAGPHGIWLGHYERAVQRAVSAQIREGDVFFDIGANAGFYSLLASRLVGARGRVLAFEPLSANLAYLVEHVRLNQADNIEVLELALAARSGRAQFDPTSSRFTGHLGASGSLEVETSSLDELVSAERVPGPSIVKMDIEGGEVEAIRGGIGLFRTSRPRLILATHGAESDRCCRQLLENCGYRIDLLSGDEVSGWCELLASPRHGNAVDEQGPK
jgi:FkbM family methyltransferase